MSRKVALPRGVSTGAGSILLEQVILYIVSLLRYKGSDVSWRERWASRTD